MWSHFILALSLLSTFIVCMPEQNNKKLKAAIKENSVEEYDDGLNVIETSTLDGLSDEDDRLAGYYIEWKPESEESKVIQVFNSKKNTCI